MKLSDLRAHEEVAAEHMREPDYRGERERTALAGPVGIEVSVPKGSTGFRGALLRSN